MLLSPSRKTCTLLPHFFRRKGDVHTSLFIFVIHFFVIQKRRQHVSPNFAHAKETCPSFLLARETCSRDLFCVKAINSLTMQAKNGGLHVSKIEIVPQNVHPSLFRHCCRLHVYYFGPHALMCRLQRGLRLLLDVIFLRRLNVQSNWKLTATCKTLPAHIWSGCSYGRQLQGYLAHKKMPTPLGSP